MNNLRLDIEHVSIKEIEKSGVLPDRDLIFIGINWFADTLAGRSYKLKKVIEEKVLVVTEKREGRSSSCRICVKIVCCNCQEIRIVRPQNAPLVKRCLECQRIHRQEAHYRCQKIRRKRLIH